MDHKTTQTLLELVKRNYAEVAIDFDVTRKKEIWPEVRKLTKTVQEGARILDAGCGNGRLLEAFLSHPINYLGIDNSPELVEVARKNYPENKFLVSDLLDLGMITNNNFDYIFCLAVLPHIPSRALRLKALRQMAAKLKPGGKIVISVWNIWSQARFRSLLIKNFCLKIIGRNRQELRDLVFPWKNSRGEKISQRYYHAFTRRELISLSRLSGLKINSIYQDAHNYWLILEL